MLRRYALVYQIIFRAAYHLPHSGCYASARFGAYRHNGGCFKGHISAGGIYPGKYGIAEIFLKFLIVYDDIFARLAVAGARREPGSLGALQALGASLAAWAHCCKSSLDTGESLNLRMLLLFCIISSKVIKPLYYRA